MALDLHGQVSVRGLVSHVRNMVRRDWRGECRHVCMPGSVNYFTKVSAYNKGRFRFKTKIIRVT